jgi:hypothetical protein
LKFYRKKIENDIFFKLPPNAKLYVVQQAKNASLKTGQHLLADPLFDIASQPIFRNA